MNMEFAIQKAIKNQRTNKEQEAKVITSSLDERQDTLYFSQDYTNKWSKIELMT